MQGWAGEGTRPRCKHRAWTPVRVSCTCGNSGTRSRMCPPTSRTRSPASHAAPARREGSTTKPTGCGRQGAWVVALLLLLLLLVPASVLAAASLLLGWAAG